MSEPCVIVGAGGHAAVLIEAMRLQGEFTPVCATTADPSRLGESVLDVPVACTDADAVELLGKDITHFALGVGAVKRTEPRRVLFERYLELGFRPATVRHPSALLSPSAELGEGLTLFAGSIVNARARLGHNVVLNTGSIIEHDCDLGADVFVGPGARVAGSVRIGEGAFVGMGATLIQEVEVGACAVIGAGAVVRADVRDREVVRCPERI